MVTEECKTWYRVIRDIVTGYSRQGTGVIRDTVTGYSRHGNRVIRGSSEVWRIN